MTYTTNSHSNIDELICLSCIQSESITTRIESKSLRCDPTWQYHCQPQGLDLGRKWFFTVLPWTWIGTFFLSVAGVFYLGEYYFETHGPLRPEFVAHFLGWSWLEQQSHHSRCLHTSWRSMFHSWWSGLANIEYVEIVLRLAGGLWSLCGSVLSAFVSWMSYQPRTTSSNWRTSPSDQNHAYGDFEFLFSLMTLFIFDIKRYKYGQLHSQSLHPPPGHKSYSSGHTARGLHRPAAWPNPVGWWGMELCLNSFDLQVEQ